MPPLRRHPTTARPRIVDDIGTHPARSLPVPGEHRRSTAPKVTSGPSSPRHSEGQPADVVMQGSAGRAPGRVQDVTAGPLLGGTTSLHRNRRGGSSVRCGGAEVKVFADTTTKGTRP